MRYSLYFIGFNFIVAFFSDLMLNFPSLERSLSPPSIKALRPYFNYQNNAIVAGFYAGATIVATLIPTMAISMYYLGMLYPKTLYSLILFLCIATPLGFLADFIIYQFQLFGTSLNKYYHIAGVGLWGAIAFVFSIVISFLLMIYFFPSQPRENHQERGK